MSDFSVSTYMPCYKIDLTANKVNLGKYNYTEMLQKIKASTPPEGAAYWKPDEYGRILVDPNCPRRASFESGTTHSVRGFELPASYAVKKPDFLSQMERTQAAAFLKNEQSGDRVEGVYDQLSDRSKDVLSKLKDGGEVEKDAWKGLCKELMDLGQLTESEYACSNLDYRLIPLGCHDANGNFVRYSNTAEAVLASRSLNQWSGQPLEMLDTWSFLLTRWGSQLAMETNPDGTPKYRDLSPVFSQASACQKLKELVNSLVELA